MNGLLLVGDCLVSSKGYQALRAVTNVIEQLAYSLNFLIYYAMNSNFHYFINHTVSKLWKSKCSCNTLKDFTPPATITGLNTTPNVN